MKYLALIFFYFTLYYSFSQTLYGIVFTNTNDKSIGNSASKNTANIQALIEDISSKINYQSKISVFKGSNFTYEKLDSVLKNFSCNPKDIIVFYINSHGYKSSTGSAFPRISIKNRTYPKRFLVSSDTINAKLKKYSNKPYLILTIIQSCNRLISKTPDLPLDISVLTDNSSQNYKTLFFSNQNIMVTSSQRGKTSIATPKGSHFTLSFIRALNEESKTHNSSPINWDKVLQTSKKFSLKLNKRRHPVWKIEKL